MLDANNRWQPWDMTKKWQETNILARRPRNLYNWERGNVDPCFDVNQHEDHAVSALRAYWWLLSDGDSRAKGGKKWKGLVQHLVAIQDLF